MKNIRCVIFEEPMFGNQSIQIFEAIKRETQQFRAIAMISELPCEKLIFPSPFSHFNPISLSQKTTNKQRLKQHRAW